jgi:hypothetical protein
MFATIKEVWELYLAMNLTIGIRPVEITDNTARIRLRVVFEAGIHFQRRF